MKKLALVLLAAGVLWSVRPIAQGIVISNPPGNGTIINNITNTTTTAGSFIESGGQVVWKTGYQFRVSASSYYINNNHYTTTEQNVTLDVADATDRFDVIAVTDTNTVVIVKGTASANPSEPTIDPGSQLKLALVSVPGSSTEPAGITTTLVYCDNAGGPTEWNWTTNGSGVVVNSSTSPQAPCTKTIDATNMASGSYAQGTIASGSFDPSTASYLVINIQSKSAWTNKRGLQVGLYNSNNVLQGSFVTISRSGSFGFDSTSTSSYQQVAIPISLFNVPSTSTVTKVRLIDFGGAINFYIGKIYFQGGAVVNQPYTLPSNCNNGDILYADNNVINCLPPTTLAPGSSSYDYSGTVNPQGVITASVGKIYLDTSTGYRYQKLAGSGNTGWYYICPQGSGSSIGPSCNWMYPSAAADGSAAGTGILTSYDSANQGAINSPLDNSGFGELLSNAGTGTTARYFTQARVKLRSLNFDLVGTIRTAGISKHRFSFGVCNSVPSSDTLPASCAIIRYSDTVDTGWIGWTSDSTPTQSATTQLSSIAINTTYIFRIRYTTSNSTIYFSVNNGAEVSKTTNLPATTASLGILIQNTDALGGGGSSLFWKNIGLIWGS